MLNRFNSNARILNKVVPKTNIQHLVNNDLTGSLEHIKLPTTNKFNSNTHSQSNTTTITNNKNTINNFYTEILQNSARYVSRTIDSFDNQKNTLTIENVNLDYGTDGITPDNFEVIVFGLHIPGDYKIEQVNNNIVITLHDRYIDFDNVTINDIYVIGKFK